MNDDRLLLKDALTTYADRRRDRIMKELDSDEPTMAQVRCYHAEIMAARVLSTFGNESGHEFISTYGTEPIQSAFKEVYRGLCKKRDKILRDVNPYHPYIKLLNASEYRGLPKHYQDDLYIHDFELLLDVTEDNVARQDFYWAIYESGTHFYDNLAGMEIVLRSTDGEKFYYHFHHGDLHPLTVSTVKYFKE